MSRRLGRHMLAIVGVMTACRGRDADPSPPKQAPIAAPSEMDATTFLAPHAGESPADTTPIRGLIELSVDDRALLERCRAANHEALTTAKDHSINAALEAQARVSPRCVDLGLANQTSEQARRKDQRAQATLRVLAKGLASSAAPCNDGAPNPQAPHGPCSLGDEELRWDGPGWSCLARSLSETDRDDVANAASYVYAFRVDARLHVFELVGQGCTLLVPSGEEVRTELVVRGRLGTTDIDALAIYRRAPRRSADK